MVRQYKRFDIDMTREPILVYPTLHYQNGGLKISPDGTTCVPGLYAAGEVSGGVHGRNRLMGNSLLDIVVFGRPRAPLPRGGPGRLNWDGPAWPTWSLGMPSWMPLG